MKLSIPKPVHQAFTFRQFVEYVGDSSILFATHSGISKLTMLLDAIAKAKKGPVEVDGAAMELLQAALNAEGDRALVIRLTLSGKLPDGTLVSEPIPPRVFAPYLKAIMEAK